MLPNLLRNNPTPPPINLITLIPPKQPEIPEQHPAWDPKLQIRSPLKAIRSQLEAEILGGSEEIISVIEEVDWS